MGSGFGVWGLDFGVWALGGLGSGLLGFGVWKSEVWTLDPGSLGFAPGLDFGVWALGSGGFGVWGLDFGVWALGRGFGVWRSEVWTLGFGAWAWSLAFRARSLPFTIWIQEAKLGALAPESGLGFGLAWVLRSKLLGLGLERGQTVRTQIPISGLLVLGQGLVPGPAWLGA